MEAHRHFASALNVHTWNLLEKVDRTAEETLEMIDSAHASNFHWRKVGTALNQARGHYLISRAYALAGLGAEALRHAELCWQLTGEHRLKGFDLAYACEAVARAQAASGNHAEARTWLDQARDCGMQIPEEEDRKLFFSDLQRAPWFGLDVSEFLEKSDQ